MWQAVSRHDSRLLKRYANVLAEWDPTAGDWRRLRDFIIATNSHVFYEQGPDYEAVLGFRLRNAGDAWVVSTLGGRGNLSNVSMESIANQLVEFLQSHRPPVLWAEIEKRPASDPIGQLIDQLMTAVNAEARLSGRDEPDTPTRRIRRYELRGA